MVPPVQPPDQLGLNSMEEVVFAQSEQVDREFFFTYSQRYIFCNNLFTGIQGANEILRPSFHFKGNNIIIRYDNGPDVQIMRSHRINYKAARVGENDGPAAAQRITRRTRWRGNNQAIGPVGVQEFAVPDDALYLLLGTADGPGFVGNPYYYDDNRGSLTVRYNVASSEITPEPGSSLMLGTGLSVLLAAVRRQGRAN